VFAEPTLVIIPAFNEAGALPAVLGRLRAAAPELDVLVVDDGSRDGTARMAAQHGVRVARLPYNLGVGGALQTGFRYAVRNGYRRAVQLDADGQHDPAQLRTLLAELDRGADLVVGSRFATGEHVYRAGFARRRAMGALRLALHLLAGSRFTDTSSGFRAFSRPMLEFFAQTYPTEFMSDTVEALLLACYGGFTVVEVPVRMQQRSQGVASHGGVRLLYQYVRLVLVLAAMASPRRRASRRATT
jgi:glycosyltransferase involved in cell wall biosynthesis